MSSVHNPLCSALYGTGTEIGRGGGGEGNMTHYILITNLEKHEAECKYRTDFPSSKTTK
jgi:hypothetical protein